MYSTKPTLYTSTRITHIVLLTSMIVGFVLTALLLIYDFSNIGHLRTRTIVAFTFLVYLTTAFLISRLKRNTVANWMLIAFYTGIGALTMLLWGLNAALGIFAMSFVIILTGVLLGSRAILPVSMGLVVVLACIQTLHTYHIVKPDLTSIQSESSYFDVISYSTILGIFALVIWVYNRQLEASLRRARNAESTVRTQKDSIARQLASESAQLRQAQQNEIQQLYKFATLGQSVTATLHELSNYLSVLTMDMDDLKHQHKNSKVIQNADESILQINAMVRQFRRKLENYDESKIFSVAPVVKRAIADTTTRLHIAQTIIEFEQDTRSTPLRVAGDPFAFSQVITVLVTNAVEACKDFPHPKVTIRLTELDNTIKLSVVDNGIGIPDSVKDRLFTPSTSSKPNGLGVGLYIAKRIVETHLKGTIALGDTARTGAEFVIDLPRKNK